MKVLIFNVNKASLKYQLIDMVNDNILAKGMCDEIGLDTSYIRHKKTSTEAIVFVRKMPDHNTAIKELISIITDEEYGVVSDMSEVIKIGICGEPGGNPSSVEIFRNAGVDYVSCSSYRRPVSRSLTAQA